MSPNSNYERGRGQGAYRRDDRSQVNHTAMTQYYDSQGLLRREVFIDFPKQVADAMGDSRTSLRRTFDHVAALHFRIKMKKEDSRSVLQPGIAQLYRFAEYQAGRKVIKEETKRFIQVHCNAVGYDEKKFEGFYQLFQSVMAYLRR